MIMEITEAEDSVRRQEHWKLLSSLKTTVEGLLSTNNPNVWSRYGGLQQLHKDMNNILSHGLKQEQVCCKQKDYWRFVWCVRYISPHLAFHVEQFSQLEPVLASGVQSSGEAHKAQRWLLHSLQEHCLSAQLQPLLRHQSHTRKYYSDEAFVLSELHVSLMLQCLEAVEQKDPGLLALVDTLRVDTLLCSCHLPLFLSFSLSLSPSFSTPLSLSPSFSTPSPSHHLPLSSSVSQFQILLRGAIQPSTAVSLSTIICIYLFLKIFQIRLFNEFGKVLISVGACSRPD